MILDATTKSIQVFMGEAISSVNPDYVSCYSDVTTSAFTPISSDGTLNGVSTVTLVSAPAASTQRNVGHININNLDTISHTITVIYNNNATLRRIIVTTLNVGESLQFNDKNGWSIRTINGSKKASSSAVITGSQFMRGAVDADSTSTQFNSFSGTTNIFYIGTATKVSSSLNALWKVTIPNDGTVTYSEWAVYKSSNYNYNKYSGPLTVAAANLSNDFTLLGYTSVAAQILVLGIYNTTISLSPSTTIGDQLYLALGSVYTGTTLRIRGGLTDDLGSGLSYSKTSTQPSTAGTNISFSLDPNGARPWIKCFLN